MSKHKYLHIFHILKCYSLFQKCTFRRKWFHLKRLFKIHRSSYILDWFWYQYNQYLMIYKESLEKVGIILRPFLAVPHLLKKNRFFFFTFFDWGHLRQKIVKIQIGLPERFKDDLFVAYIFVHLTHYE